MGSHSNPSTATTPNHCRRSVDSTIIILYRYLLLPHVSTSTKSLSHVFQCSKLTEEFEKKQKLRSMPIFWPVLIPYLVWICAIDRAPEKGGRTHQAARQWSFWKLFASYFPISLVKVREVFRSDRGLLQRSRS